MIENATIFFDCETYYDDVYSLRKMPTPNYILDDRFELIMVAVDDGQGPPRIIDGPDFGEYLAKFNPETTTTVSFNSLFDNSILAWHYAFVPRWMRDTLGMSRALLGHKLRRFSLGHVAEHLELGSKGTMIANVKGMRRQQIIDAGLWNGFKEYCLDDNYKNMGIYGKLYTSFPDSERRFMDLVIRCTVEPKFMGDVDLLTQHIADLKAEKRDLLLSSLGPIDNTKTYHPDELDVLVEQAKKVVMSSAKFETMLKSLNVEIEYKTTPTGKTAPAFAKTDQFMADLAKHPDSRVQALAAARIGSKSTLEETRSEKFLSIASLDWDRYRDGKPRLYSGGTLPIPLRYGAAHTHRLGGDWGMNPQNMPTEMKSKGKSKLRRALAAPPGHDVLAVDLGQIEARLSAWLAQCLPLLDLFIRKDDPYADLATKIFGFKVNRKIHQVEGFIGKTGVLGLGYGCGAEKFFSMVVMMARAMGIELGDVWTPELAKTTVDTYRKAYWQIPTCWKALDRLLHTAWMGKCPPIQFGPGGILEISHGCVMLRTNGLAMQYENPQYGFDNQLIYFYGGSAHKIYGAKMMENIIQFLARIIVSNAALRISDRGYRFKLQAHDELVFIVPKSETEHAKRIISTEMVRPPSWAPDLPLTITMNHGASYADAK